MLQRCRFANDQPAPAGLARKKKPEAMPSAITHLLYLHGFRSSPRSTKARQVGAWVAARRPDLVWWCPQLPASPRQAAAEVFATVDGWPSEHMAVIGSSRRPASPAYPVCPALTPPGH